MNGRQQTNRTSRQDPFHTLRKILELDSQKYQYADRAVTGGVSRFVDAWLQQAKAFLPSPTPHWVDSLAELLRAYSTATPEQRQRMIGVAMRYLVQLDSQESAGRGVPAELTARPAIIDRTQGTPSRPAAKPAGTVCHTGVPAVEPAPPAKVATRPAAKATARPGASAPSKSTRRPAPAALPRNGGPAFSTQRIPGIGPVYARKLARMGINTIQDLLYHLPHRYIDYRDLRRVQDLAEGVLQSVRVTVWEAHAERTLRGKKRVVAVVGDETGTMEAIWWNQEYLAGQLTPGRQLVLSGTPGVYHGHLQFQPDDWEFFEKGELVNTARMVPVHPLTEGMTAPWLRRKIKEVVDQYAGSLPDALPEAIRSRHALMPIARAIQQAHFPDSPADLKAARRRLAFDEFLMIQLGLMRRRREWQAARAGVSLEPKPKQVQAFLDSLPFHPTDAQQRVIDEISEDMQKPYPMMRLLQGDVGSGKTLVATVAMVMAAANGFQSVLMAPTEVLAEQHYRTLTSLLVGVQGVMPLGEPVLLTGSITGAARKKVLEAIRNGEAKVVVGTQALIQDGVEFDRLGLAVVDEQHRFGVEQRGALCQKGHNPHLLVMTATPIPRTLSMTLYGDLDLSIIDELPPGRQEIETIWFRPEQRRAAYGIVHREVEQGHQAFIVCPLVEESEALEARAATTEHQRLQERVFPNLRLGLLHGKMRPKDKDAVMTEFRDGKLDVLVCTPVVEVGIDIPNATVMMVEGADRFGLAQLHQFRGRVGRGPARSRCLLLADSVTMEGGQRLQAIVDTRDGFKLAEVDLEMRGPGEFLGTRQSGLPDLKVAGLSDTATLELARAVAAEIFACDPDLAEPGHRLLAERLEHFWQDATPAA